MSDASVRRDAFTGTRNAALATTAVAAALVVSGLTSGVNTGALFTQDGLARAGQIVSGLLRPHLDQEFLVRVARLLAESVAIGSLGVALALLLGIPLALCATRLPALTYAADARPSKPRQLARAAARTVLAMFRSVPEIVWAYLFVRIFGLGPAPAVLAIGLSFAGIIGKLYAELAEAADPAVTRSLAASGNSWFTQFLYGVLPQVRRGWSGYALFRLECAVRSAAILGVVGAGGLGAEIELSIRYFQYDRLSTALLALVAAVVLMEIWSARVRRRDAGHLDLWTVGGAALFGLVSLDANWGALFEPASLRSALAFLSGFMSPAFSHAFSLETLGLVGETLGMAAFGTLVAAIIAGVLAPLASQPLLVGGYLRDTTPTRGAASWLLRGVLLSVRGLLAALRALPELVLALIFVVWVGPGPLAGALAIAAHTVGILGRLFAEVYEDSEAAPARLLESAGATRFGIWLYGLLPQATPRLLAFVLFRFEVNVRATAMVGFVGAGGLGDAIHTAISLFHMSDLAALLLLLFGTVVLVDTLGDRLRRRLLA